MNKKLKIATAAVSVVMAGTMAVAVFGCTKNTPEPTTDATKIVSAVNSKLNYGQYISLCGTAYNRLVSKEWVGSGAKQDKITLGDVASTDTIDLKFNVGDKNTRSISYISGAKLLTGTVILPDGTKASPSELKPVWSTIQSKLSSDLNGATVTFTDKYKNDSDKIEKAVSTDKDLATYDLITDGVTNVAKHQDKLLDLSNYLDEMPNYKAFLDANPTVKDSLTFNGGSMYYAPYFDGYNDVEKYSLFKLNWVESLLDGTGEGSSQTWKASMEAKEKNGTATSIQSFMGKTGSWNTDALDKDGNKVAGGITVNYDKALAAAKSETAPLGAAYKAAAGEAYSGDSGNIVDIMNAAINKKGGAVTGAQLRKIMQEYIKVAYYVGTTDTAFYTQTGYKLSDVFNGSSAAWDVDLFAALGRVMITNPTLLKSGSAGSTIGGTNATALKDTYLVCAREENMQRHADIVSWVGELYGVRGLESRYAYAYIDANGKYQDIRGSEAGYEAMKSFNNFYEEGLVFLGKPSDGKKAKQSYYSDSTIESLALHDYLNTQTPAGFKVSGDTQDKDYNIEEGYNYTANLTAVSKWDVNGSGSIDNDEYFRFTESWRSVKDSGIAVPLDAVKNDSKKLKAILTLIDYIFSDDGQITMAYGAPAASANGDGGFWYNPEVPADTTVAEDGSVEVGGKKYEGTFTYGGKKYATDTIYGGKGVPTLTQNTLDAYVGKAANGYTYGNVGGGSSESDSSKWTFACTMSYTDFARAVMGSALNFGNKLTSLEYQMTSQMGKAGAEKVDNALNNGVIRHVTPSLSSYQYTSKWYTIAPTSLPFTTAETATDSVMIKDCSDLYQKGTVDTVFTNSKKTSTNLYLEIIWKGYKCGRYNGMFEKLGLNG